MKQQNGGSQIIALRSIVPRLVLIAGGLVFALLLAELGLHLFPGLLPPAVQQAIAIYGDSRATEDTYKPFIADDQLMLVPQPDLNLTIHSGMGLQYTVQTRALDNSGIGFRDIGATEPTYAVAVGDSFTWGTNVAAAETWVERLQARFAAPVLNLGVRSYGPSQYQIVTEDHGLVHRPKVIIWGFFAGNDNVNSADYADWVAGGKRDLNFIGRVNVVPNWLSQHVRIYELARLLLHRGVYRQGSNALSVPQAGGPNWLFYPQDLRALADGSSPQVARGWELTRQAIRETAAAVRAADAELVILIIPPKELVYWPLVSPHLDDPHAFDLAEPIRSMDDFCLQEALHCLDITPAFIEQAQTGAELYFRQDAHWNPAGHQLAADLLADYLTAQGLQP